jgi:hypothetical protein
MSDYKLGRSEGVIRKNDGAFIPNDPLNVDWIYYQEWKKFNIPDAADPDPSLVPVSASKLGLKRAFGELGIWETVRSAIASNPDAQEEWELAIEVKRTDPLVQIMIAALNFGPTQVDNLLIRSAALVA